LGSVSSRLLASSSYGGRQSHDSRGLPQKSSTFRDSGAGLSSPLSVVSASEAELPMPPCWLAKRCQAFLKVALNVQELLEHPFLRPSAAPAPGLVGVTRSQLKKLLAQLSTVSASNSRADIDALSDELFRQLSNGEAVDLAALVAKPGKASQQHLPPPSSAGRLHQCLM
jgi:hypothetical protein